MKKGLTKIWSIVLAVMAFLASLPQRYIDNAVKAGLFAPPVPRAMAMTVATEPQAGFGIAITWAGHDIGYMRDIGYSGISSGVIDSSSHDSEWKTKMAGMLDGGEVTIPIYFIFGDTTGQKYLLADIKSQTERQGIITFPDGGTITFNAICTKFGDITGPVEGMVEASITLTVNGEPAFSDIE